ncbi:MAG: hypothetical protein E2O68_09585 [Deltaproteobacteria bacterium]|nr:MAG: hypothetical protein E2O68_09585 [Deltaproteobacteria bacterium]
MTNILNKFPFLLELFFNGTFILFYSLNMANNIPVSWDMDMVHIVLDVGTWLIPIVIFICLIFNYLQSEKFEVFFRKHIISLVVFVPLVITWGDQEFAFWLSCVHLLASILSLYDEDAKESSDKKFRNTLLKLFALRPAQLVFLSFSGVILIGTFLLALPLASTGPKALSFIDALFTATSATCVTGLSTISTASDLSWFGQGVVLILIQIGGLSIMTLYSSMAILLGKAMGMKERVVMQDLLDVASLDELFLMIVNIIKYTFFIELWGAIILTFAFSYEGFEFGESLYYGLFHSISAFCNAGFSLFDTSLESFATSPLITGTICVLITLGGVGFIVLRECRDAIINKRALVRLTLHTKIVLLTTLFLTVGGALFIFFGEFVNGLEAYTLWEKIQVSIFQSITLRTAGFNTIPMTNLHGYTLYGMTLFMFIGGSPGSTAGGVKTTTLSILVQSIITTLKGKQRVTIFDRNIPGPMVVRATALTFIYILTISFFILVLMKLEPKQTFLPLFFEAVSAGATVGLTLGVTPSLSVLGKIFISLLMLIGRIGPLTLVLAVGGRIKEEGKFDYPDGRVLLG